MYIDVGIEATACAHSADTIHLPCKVRLSKLGLWTLKDRRVRSDLVEVFKIVHGLSPIRFGTFFEIRQYDRTTGHSLKLHKSSIHTDLRQHFFTERIINIRNSLDEHIISATSVNSFKARLQKLYKDESFPRLDKSMRLRGTSQLSGEAHTGKILVRSFYYISFMTIPAV